MEIYWASTRMARNQWERTGGKFELWKTQEVNIADVTFRSPLVEGHVRPIVLTAEVPEVTIPIGQECTRIHIPGQVTFGTGYPLTAAPDLFGKMSVAKNSQFGDTAAEYTLEFADEKTQIVPVRQGIELAQANRIYGASRILPIATSTQPALEYIKDIAREHYQILLWSIRTDQDMLKSLSCKLVGAQENLAIFAVTTESICERDLVL